MPDSQMIDELFARHAGTLVLYARQWLDDSTAEDVVQEVFINLMDQSQLPENARAWLYRCVRNAAVSAGRSRRRRLAREQAVSSGRSAWFDPSPGVAMDAEQAAQLLKHLPAEKREAVVLRIWGDLGFPDIARIMQMPVSTVFHHYRTALAEIRQKMEPLCPNRQT